VRTLLAIALTGIDGFVDGLVVGVDGLFVGGSVIDGWAGVWGATCAGVAEGALECGVVA
jgi:hypothetical protein